MGYQEVPLRKLTPRHHAWIRFKANKGLERRALLKSKRHAPTSVLVYGGKSWTVRRLGGHTTPSELCLDRAYEGTAAFFNDLRQRTIFPRQGLIRHPTGRRPSRIGWVRNFCDFKPLKRISAGAALILASEYDRTARRTGIAPATLDIEKWDPYVATILSRLGFFNLLHLEPYGHPPGDALIVKPMVAQDKTNELATASIKDLFAEIHGSKQLRIDLSSAVSDAVENVVGHAYPIDWPHRRLHVPFWWFVGAADPEQRRVTLVIYDQGVTIPVSLPRKWSMAHLTTVCLSLFRTPFRADDPTFDGQTIDAAMAIGSTSTGESYRGRGLAKICEIIQRCAGGRLRIVSRHGECVYGADGHKTIKNHQIPLNGTYVELEASFVEEEE